MVYNLHDSQSEGLGHIGGVVISFQGGHVKLGASILESGTGPWPLRLLSWE